MMTNEQYESIYEFVRGYLNGCPDAVVRNTIYMATSRWCNDVCNLTSICGPYNLEDRNVYFDLFAPSEGRIIMIQKVFTEYGKVDSKFWGMVNSEFGKKLVLRTFTLGAKTISAKISWCPTEETDELPEEWFVNNKQAICDGVLYTLLSQTTKPWGDQSTAMYFMQEYNKAKTDAIYEVKAEGEKGGQLSCFDPSESLAGFII